MRLKKIIINHYKSIKSTIDLDNLSGFHILVGPNNAGKTNLLDAIHLFFEKNLEKEKFFDKDGDIELALTHQKQDHLLQCKKGEVLNSYPSFLEKRFVRINSSLNYLEITERLKEFKKKHAAEYQAFSLVLENYFKEIEISEELFLVSILTDHKKRSEKRMGEGFKRLFVILFYIFHPDYDIILIDEPEIHLHPSIIRKFLYILDEKKCKKQIFFTTHHPSFVQARYLKNTWRISRNERGSTCVHRMSPNDIDTKRFIQEINDDNSAMLFSEKVLLVEGVSDRIFMREMINKFYRKNKDIKVVYTSGKGSVDLYADLCEVYNIPYAVMLDKDALYSPSLERIKKYPPLKGKVSFNEKISKLQEKEIFILDKDLENVYPSRYKEYKKKETKPLAALFISQKITAEDLQMKNMRVIKEVLEKI